MGTVNSRFCPAGPGNALRSNQTLPLNGCSPARLIIEMVSYNCSELADMYFPTTHWSLLAKATLSGETAGRTALNELCRSYWFPLKQFIVARGYPEAQAADLTQEFIVHLLEREALSKPDRSRGKFRSFLLGALGNFLSHERERRLAQKRGGAQPHVSVEVIEAEGYLANPRTLESDEAEFDRAWALAVVQASLNRVERSYVEGGQGALFAVLRSFLPGGTALASYEEAAARAGLSVAALNSHVHRMRRQFREAVCTEVTATVSAPHEIDEEIAYLYRVLMDRGTDFEIPES